MTVASSSIGLGRVVRVVLVVIALAMAASPTAGVALPSERPSTLKPSVDDGSADAPERAPAAPDRDDLDFPRFAAKGGPPIKPGTSGGPTASQRFPGCR